MKSKHVYAFAIPIHFDTDWDTQLQQDLDSINGGEGLTEILKKPRMCDLQLWAEAADNGCWHIAFAPVGFHRPNALKLKGIIPKTKTTLTLDEYRAMVVSPEFARFVQG